MTLAIVLSVATLIIFVYQHFQLVRTRKALEHYENESAGLLTLLKLKDDKIKVRPEPELRIMVEVIDPLALAKKRSDLAKLTAGTAPNITRKIVYDRVMEKMKKDMADEEVEAVIELQII